MGGINKINKALGIFTKIETQLNQGISECLNEAEVKTQVMARLNQEITTLETNKTKAERVVNKLKEIIG